MNMKQFLVDMAITASVGFVVAGVVTYLYSLIVHGTGSINWETAFDLAIVLGIVLPLTSFRSRREQI